MFSKIRRFVIFLLGSVFLILPFPWNESIENTLTDIQFKIRGDRKLGDEIAVVFIGAEDVKAFNGWPITRDYYGYLIHILQTSGAKVIGIDVLLNRADLHYPEYDTMLADFFQSASNVCLPMAFAELINNQNTSKFSPDLLNGHGAIFPIELFMNQAASLGFSNLSKSVNMRNVPLVITSGDSVMLSFGSELARLYLDCTTEIRIKNKKLIFVDSTNKEYTVPLDRLGQLRLNHFGDIDDLATISLLDLFQAFERAPESLNFKDKLVVVAITAPGIANLESTPLSRSLPATLIHVTVADNLIHQNFLRELILPFHLLLIACFILLGWFIWQAKRNVNKVIGSIGILLIYWMISMVVFSRNHFILPLFYPTIAFLVTIFFESILRRHQRKIQETSIKTLLEKEVSIREAQLKTAKSRLTELQHELKQQTTVSEQTKLLAEEREVAILKLEKELRDLQTVIVAEKEPTHPQFAEIVHSRDSKMTQVLELVSKVSEDNIPVLIAGETGTGKEMIARAIHQTSRRRNALFVAINCGALPETLLDSELFGHEKGSFTGAHTRRRGRFELADGGTIFLDEITETTPSFQARLLRVLQGGTFERVGGEQTIQVNVRVIAATNKDLQVEMEEKRFRADLFYRLNGFPINLPPLRERPKDIPMLAVHFLKKHGYPTVPAFSGRAIEMLQNYHWPGNVRELENVVRRAAILAQSEGREIIRESDLPTEFVIKKVEVTYKPLDDQILESLRSLEFSRSAISQTAKALGNRDRGTITEYFRGICFERLVKSAFNVEQAAKAIAAATDDKIVERVKTKIQEYLNNLSIEMTDAITEADKLSSTFKGLPQKYHVYLQQLLDHLKQSGQSKSR